MAVDSKLPGNSTLRPSCRVLRWRVPLINLPFWPRRSMYLRLQWSHLATSLLPLLLLGGTLLMTSAEAERRVVENTQLAMTDWIARDIAADITRSQSELLSLGRQLPFDAADRQVLETATSTFMAHASPTPVEFVILGADGQQLVRITRDRIYFPSELTNDRRQPFFTRAVQGLTYRATITDARGQQLLELAVPANDAVGQVKGVIMVQVEPSHIETVLQSLPATTARSAFIVDDQGAVVLGEPATVRQATGTGASGLAQGGRWPVARQAGAGRATVEGEDLLIAQSSIAPGGWWLVVEQPASVALQGANRRELVVALILSLTSIGVVVWSLLLARRMTRPIRELRDASRLLASGHLGRTIEVTREDELGQLASEFNRMSLRLAESQHALEERNLRLQQGLTLARHIQQDLLPAEGPPSKAVRTYAISEPASEVGGDFYTYLVHPDGRITFVVGDASGKGVAAALVMALTSTLVESHAPRAQGPGALLMALNTQLYPRLNASHSSVALLVSEFEPKTGLLRVANAGMIAPLLPFKDHCIYVPSYGPPLGVVPSASFVEQAVTLAPGQTVVFASDGLVEARNHEGEMWGFERMECALCEVGGSPPEVIVEHLRREVGLFTRDTEAADDMTIIASQFTGVAA